MRLIGIMRIAVNSYITPLFHMAAYIRKLPQQVLFSQLKWRVDGAFVCAVLMRVSARRAINTGVLALAARASRS